MVGRNQARHDRLTEPYPGVDDDGAPVTGDGVGREQHPGEVGVDQSLHYDRDGHVTGLDSPCRAVGDGTVVPQ
ncbi:hypothetical protein G7085_17410 [Tessaracoccus sp. HDW20]|nr:hypothetical protein [Tessaracoccus coleopterorum]